MSKIVVRNTQVLHTVKDGIKKIWKYTDVPTPEVSFYLTDNNYVILTTNNDEFLTT